jgi:hypothetical protein
MFFADFSQLKFIPYVLDIKFGNIGVLAICFHAKVYVTLKILKNSNMPIIT